MRIEKELTPTQPIQKQPSVHSSWKDFFAQFSTLPSEEQQQEIIQNFVQHLSHIIYQNMQKMINIYKKMKE